MSALEHETTPAARRPRLALVPADERCHRTFHHRPHTFIDDHDTDHACPGLWSASCYAELLDQRPQLAGIGLASILHTNEVMSA